jgi:hypothetical protein
VIDEDYERNPHAVCQGLKLRPKEEAIELVERKIAEGSYRAWRYEIRPERSSEEVAIFGSPKAGTPLMLAAPSIAIDLPLKILISEDRDGKVWVSYNSVMYLQERHGLPQELLQNIAVVETLAARAAE